MFILASNSPRRKEILSKLSIEFKIIVSQIHEVIDPSLTPLEVAESLSRQKALDVYMDYPNDIILGFDTIVVLNQKIYPKPKNPTEAGQFLRELSGKTHQVITGMTIASKFKMMTCSEISYVTFKILTEESIQAYVDSLEWMDKAGGYAIQGIGRNLIDRYEGDLENIIGLPLNRLKEELKNLLS